MEKKKIIIPISILAVAGLVTVSCLIGHSKLQAYKNKKGELPVKFTYTAHTGCCNTPDNSIESIKVGESYGANIVEFDLRFDEQQRPILSHDEPVGGEVTLEEAFAVVSKYPALMVNVDAKTYGALWQVQDQASKYNILDRIFFTGVDEEHAEIVKTSAPEVKYYLNVDVKKPSEHTEEYLLSLVKKVKDAGAIGINFNKNSASKELVDIFHENGLLVSIFTVDTEYEMYKILSFAPDNITTRNPDKLKEILKEY